MSANNLVTSRYISALRSAAAEDVAPKRKGNEKRKEKLKKKMEKDGSWSTSTTSTVPEDASGVSTTCPATPTPSFGGSPSSDDVSGSLFPVVGPSLFLDVSLERFRQVGLGRRQAHCPQDVLLCWKMCALMGLEANVPDVFISMLFRVTKLLHRCGYHTQDIVTMGSHAVIYSVDVLKEHLGNIDWKEAANMVGLQMFIAHAYLMDEHCPLKEWHTHIFAQYCSLSLLTSAILQLMRSRGYKLSISSGLQRVHKELLAAVATYRWNPRILEDRDDGSVSSAGTGRHRLFSASSDAGE